ARAGADRQPGVPRRLQDLRHRASTRRVRRLQPQRTRGREPADPRRWNSQRMMMALKIPIFMDNHSTTPVDPRVLEAMLPYFTHDFGNAASRNHAFGWKAEAAVEKAREQVAALIGANAKEIVWASGATEGNSLAIKGVADYYRPPGRHVVIAGADAKS